MNYGPPASKTWTPSAAGKAAWKETEPSPSEQKNDLNLQ